MYSRLTDSHFYFKLEIKSIRLFLSFLFYLDHVQRQSSFFFFFFFFLLKVPLLLLEVCRYLQKYLRFRHTRIEESPKLQMDPSWNAAVNFGVRVKFREVSQARLIQSVICSEFGSAFVDYMPFQCGRAYCMDWKVWKSHTWFVRGRGRLNS